MNRCRKCGSVLEFVGLDRRQHRVMQCVANVSVVDTRDGVKTHSSVPCNFEFIVDGGSFKNEPNWFARAEDREDRGPRESWARCRDHGPELATMRRRAAA